MWRFLLLWLIAFLMIGVLLIPAVEQVQFSNRQVHARMIATGVLSLAAASLIYFRFLSSYV